MMYVLRGSTRFGREQTQAADRAGDVLPLVECPPCLPALVKVHLVPSGNGMVPV